MMLTNKNQVRPFANSSYELNNRKSLKIILIKNIFFLHHFMHIYKGDGIEIVQENNLVIHTHAIY